MWKDFFYYTKSQRRAVCVLLTLIALLLMGIWLLPEAKKPQMVEASRVDSVALKDFEQEVRKKPYAPKKKESIVKEESQIQLFPFDPNKADSIELSSLGLPSYVVRNVLKYREKGGRFRTADSFGRIYGLSEKQFNALKPYIRIAQADKQPKKEKVDKVVADTILERKVFKYPEGTLVDVNVADTAELKKIPGIGSGIAKAIVAYRNRLGGFYSLSQLEEIDYVTPELLKWFKLEGGAVRKLDINRWGLDKLRSHPYLNFYQAKVIIEHRRKRGEIKSLSQLSLYEEFTEKDLIRLSAYVSFD